MINFCMAFRSCKIFLWNFRISLFFDRNIASLWADDFWMLELSRWTPPSLLHAVPRSLLFSRKPNPSVPIFIAPFDHAWRSAGVFSASLHSLSHRNRAPIRTRIEKRSIITCLRFQLVESQQMESRYKPEQVIRIKALAAWRKARWSKMGFSKPRISVLKTGATEIDDMYSTYEPFRARAKTNTERCIFLGTRIVAWLYQIWLEQYRIEAHRPSWVRWVVSGKKKSRKPPDLEYRQSKFIYFSRECSRSLWVKSYLLIRFEDNVNITRQ